MELCEDEVTTAIKIYVKEIYGWVPDKVVFNMDRNGDLDFVYVEQGF